MYLDKNISIKILIFNFHYLVDSTLCCDPEQILYMDEQMQMAEGIFGRCTTCLKNMLQILCGMSCSDQADKYMTTYLKPIPGIADKFYVASIDINVSETNLQKVYDSCVQTIHPSSGKLAMDLACGRYGAKACNPERWYKFMGDAETNPIVPFTINYIISDDPEHRFEGNYLMCNESYPVNI